MTDTPKINISLKLDGQKPWVTVYGDTPAEVAAIMEQITALGIGSIAGATVASLQSGFEVGGQLGGEQVASIPVAQPPAPQQFPAPQQAYAAPAAPAPAQQYAAPAPAPAPQAAGMAQGPLILGQPAKLVQSKPGAARAWSAWADPRPQAVTAHITEKTNDPNDPGLAAGIKTFWQFIR